MKKQEFDALIKDFLAGSAGVLTSKSHDYADQDVLSNFKRVTQIAKLYDIKFREPYEYAMFMVLMKLDRLQNLKRQGKSPQNESLKDTMQDATNYLLLAFACIVES